MSTWESYFILNTLRIIRCIDDARCEEVQRFTPEDGQPEKVGQYRVVVGMRIDPAKVGDEQEGLTGTRFLEV